MTKKVRIALDAMGGDFGVSVVVPAALEYVKKDPDVSLMLVGIEEDIKKQLAGQEHPQISIQHASQIVEMGELPSKALRGKKDSSMRVAINQIKAGNVDACVSAGNTGALMATARFVLKMLPHVDRPAIITTLPGKISPTYMLDLGANVDCGGEQLFQFAVMGGELAYATGLSKSPRIGLLNVGQEEIKGNERVKHAHELLSKSSLNYIGYVEGDDIFLGDADVIVVDGFVGNVSLKSIEGLAKLIGLLLKEGFHRNFLTKIAGLIAYPVLRRLKQQIDPRQYNGASLLGLRGIVIKSHGSADITSYQNAIKIAKEQVFADVPTHISTEVEKHLAQAKKES